jgi:hypothetical protein
MHLPRWVLFATIAFGVVEFTNISLEQFVGLPAPWNAIIPASAMGLIVLTAATVAVRASVMNAVFVVEGGMFLAASGALLWVALQRQSELVLTFKNAATHLAILPFVAAIAGAGAIAVSRVAHARGVVSLAGVPLVISGVLLLIHMSGLPRSQRPPFVLSGFGLCALGLVLLPCAAGAVRETEDAMSHERPN